MLARLGKWLSQRRAARREALSFEREVAVVFADQYVEATFPSGSAQRILWDEVVSITIETNDTGPWGADFWWILEDKRGERCAFPQGATGEDATLDVIGKRFPEFDFQAFTRACGSTENATFVCWQQKAS
jgi:hypothetical protein